MTNVVYMFKRGKKADFPNYRTVIWKDILMDYERDSLQAF